MCIYYEVLRPASDDDMREAGPRVAKVLKRLPKDGYVPNSDLKDEAAAVAWACASGVMRRASLSGRVLRFESVRFWIGQLSSPKTRNAAGSRGTRRSYASAMDAFNEWLGGKSFPVGKGGSPRSFPDVEKLLRFCGEPGRGHLAARRVLRQYLAESAEAGCSASTAMVRCSAIKSYFSVHDVPLDIRVNRNRHMARQTREDQQMSLADFYRMMTAGKMNVMARAVMMIKFQAGLDSSTLADRFNYEAYGQIVRHMGTEDYDAWDPGRCPVPVRLVRVKTGLQYTTFLDRDALSHLRDYLRWREFRGDRYDGSGPLFVTQVGTPISPDWVSSRFFRAAVNAGIQKRISRGTYRVRSHDTRDLLKSTLLVAGCAPYAADHVLGHYPRDSYEKQAILYPEELRREYAKASGMINALSGIESSLGAAGEGTRGDELERGRLDEIREQQRQTREALRRMADAISEVIRFGIPERRRGPNTPLGETLRSIRDLSEELGRGGGGATG